MAGVASVAEERVVDPEKEPTSASTTEVDKAPKSLAELDPKLHHALKIIQTDPSKSFGEHFHLFHHRNGTADLPVEDRNRIEVQVIANDYLDYLVECGGERCPDDARQLLDNALIEALEARGVEIDGPIELGEIAKIAAGPRQDGILSVLGESELKERLSALFDENGYLFSKDALTPERAAKVLGLGEITPDILTEGFRSYSDFQSLLDSRLGSVSEIVNGVLQALPGLDSESKQRQRVLINQGLCNAYDVIDNIGKAALGDKKSEPEPKTDEVKAEEAVVDPDKGMSKDLKKALNLINKLPKKISNPSFSKGFFAGLLGTCGTFGYYLLAVKPALATAAVLATQGPWLLGALAVGAVAFGTYYGISKLVRKSRLAYNHRLENDKKAAQQIIEAAKEKK